MKLFTLGDIFKNLSVLNMRFGAGAGLESIWSLSRIFLQLRFYKMMRFLAAPAP
jgi:hypothetical protein